MRSGRRPRELFGYSAWAVAVVLLVMLAGAALVGAIAHAGYDPHENRAPGARIAIAAVALAVALAAVSVPVGRLRGTHGKLGLGAGLALTWGTVVLLFVLALVDLASGPL